MRLKKVVHVIRKRKVWIIALLILIGVGYYFLFIRGKSDEDELSYTVKRQTIREELSLSGTVEATSEATLAFQTAGKLAWIGVREGDYVRKGQAVASLDQRSLRKTLEKELNDYAKERLDFDQNKDDMREVVIGALNYDTRQSLLRTAEQAQYDLTNSVLDVELQTLSIELANLSSPIDGIVTKVGTKNAGVNIIPSQATIQVVNPDTLYFSASVDQTDVVKLAVGKIGTLLLDSFPDSQLKGVIHEIGFTPVEGESETVYEVKLMFDDPSDRDNIRLGMTGDANFIVKEKENSIAVPTSFLKMEKDKSYVWIKDKSGKRIKRFVQEGEEIDIATEIYSGLEAGDVIYD